MTTRTAIASDTVEARMSGHLFGTGKVTEVEFVQETPEALRVLAISLNEQSRLLQLRPHPEQPLEKQMVYDAYQHDLALLTGRVTDFERCVRHAIRCSIVSRNMFAPLSEIESETKKLWDELNAQIPPAGKRPLLLLDFQLAAQEARTILSTLQDRFRQGVTHVLRLFTYWLHLLVENALIGLVEWSDVDVARYHYFLHDRQKAILNEKHRQDVKFDPSQPEGRRTTYTDITDRIVRRQDFQERHVHDIVNARVYDLADYPDQVPSRVAEFLNEVPKWLRPLLQIVAGDITTQEIIRHKTNDQTVVESEITSVYKTSPAVTLGDFALMGWSADDLKNGSTCYFRGQQAKSMHKRLVFSSGGVIAACAALAAIGLFWLGLVAWKNAQAGATDRYNAYVAALDASAPFLTARKGDPLMLEGEDTPIFLSGIGESPGTTIYMLRFLRKEQAAGAPLHHMHSVTVPTREWDNNYGDVDFGPEFGVFAILHLVEVSADHIKYKVTYYGSRK